MNYKCLLLEWEGSILSGAKMLFKSLELLKGADIEAIPLDLYAHQRSIEYSKIDILLFSRELQHFPAI